MSAGARPNILIAITDDWSGGHAGVYGCRWIRTPAFDRVAREGVLFTEAYTPNAKCAPSRAALLTGRSSWQLREAANHIGLFPPDIAVFPDALAAAGYRVGLTNKGWGPGLALHADGSPRSLLGKPFDARKAPAPTTAMKDTDYAANFQDFLEAGPEDQPWCFWYGASDPHRPYEAGSGARLGGKRLADIDRVPGYWPDNATVRSDMLDYALAVEHFDRHLGTMLAALDARGSAENTIVLVTSDHGMPFPRAKGQAYPFGTHLPLAIRWPRGIANPGRTVDEFVSHIDIAPTLMRAAEIDWPATGRDYLDLLRDQPDPTRRRDHVLVGQERHDVGRPGDVGYPIRGILSREWVYLENFAPDRWPACNPETGYLNCDGSPTKTWILRHRDGAETRRYWDLAFGKRGPVELYDRKADPDCLHNLAERPERQEIRERLHTQLHDELRTQGDPRVAGQGDVFDRYPVVPAHMARFYEQWQNGSAPLADWVEPTDFESLPCTRS